jgi:alanine racemase
MLHINLGNLTKNVKELTSGKRKLIGVVKNNAYGCGIVQVSRHLINLGVDFLLINDIYEIKPLLDDGIKTKIIVHNSVNEISINTLKENPNIIVTINNIEDAKMISKHFGKPLTVHIQIDTGMNRIGIKTIEEFDRVIEILKTSEINIEGIYTHFASPNSMERQLEKFKAFSERYNFSIIHCASTSTWRLTDYGNYIRVGLDLYDINQVMSVVTKPVIINKVKKGELIGYESEYTAEEDINVAILPIGYGDGYRRRFEGFHVYANNNLYPIIGRICMNHLFIKVDDNANLNTEFELLSNNLPARVLGGYANCSKYEIYTMFKVYGVEYIQ